MSIQFIVYNNKIIKFGTGSAGKGIVFDSENSGSTVVADPIANAVVTAELLSNNSITWMLDNTYSTFDHIEYWVTGYSSNKKTSSNSTGSITVDNLISTYGLTAPDNSSKSYSLRLRAVAQNGAVSSTATVSFTVQGAVVETPTTDPITQITFTWTVGTGSNPSMSFTPSTTEGVARYEVGFSKVSRTTTMTDTSFSSYTVASGLGYSVAAGSSATGTFKVRAVGTNGAYSSWSTSRTVTLSNASSVDSNPWDSFNVTLYDEKNYLGFDLNNYDSMRVMNAIVTPSETTSFRTITIYSNDKQMNPNKSGSGCIAGPRIFRLSNYPGTADGGSGSGNLTGLHAETILNSDNMEVYCSTSENGTLTWTTDYGSCYGKPVTINGQQMYAYEARLNNGNNITLNANNIYLIGLNPYTGPERNSDNQQPNTTHYITMLSDYTVAEGSTGKNGYANTNNTSTIPTRCGYYNTTQANGNSSIARGLPMFCVDGSVFTKFSDYSINVTEPEPEVDPMTEATITATSNTTSVSWTNLSSISTFARYEYYLSSNTSNVKTTTSNSVTIATLKNQFSLTPTSDTTYQLRVRGVSSEGNYTNEAAVTFTVTGTGSSSSDPVTASSTTFDSYSIVSPIGSDNNAAAFLVTPSETVSFKMISVYYGGRATSNSNSHWHLDMLRIAEMSSSSTDATLVSNIKTDANSTLYATGTDVDTEHTSTDGYSWRTQTNNNATSTEGIFKSRGVDTNIAGIGSNNLIRYTSYLTDGSNITLEAGKTYIIGFQAAVSAGSNNPNYATLVMNNVTGNSNNCVISHKATSECTINAKFENYLPYFEIGSSLDNMQPFTKFSGISITGGSSSDSGTTTETDPMTGRNITVTSTSTTVSWTNLSAISTFSTYEYYLSGNESNYKTTTSNSVTIATLKQQFNLAADSVNTIYVRAKSSKGNYSNVGSTTFTVPGNSSSSGGSESTTTVTSWTEDFSDGISNVTNDSNGWYNLALVDGKLRAILEEPDTTMTVASFFIDTGTTVDLTNGAYFSIDIGDINNIPEDYTGNGAEWNPYNCLAFRLIDSSGTTSDWINIDANGLGNSTNGIGSGNLPTVQNVDISSYLGSSLIRAKVVKIEMELICYSGDMNKSDKFKKRNKGLTFDNIKLSNSAS